ncbi:unnamed protein product [Parnassius apollo]|uniref:(apollo) hypothetical protein n=1 Tax=Parnassius apollo TaxID=110799 RepID=A0A8S3W0U2_PARAO|nr:unnamed protein product [Parnassius apollo]
MPTVFRFNLLTYRKWKCKRSFYWNFFEKDESKNIVCKICSSKIKRHMVRHFKTRHRALYLKIQPLIQEKTQSNPHTRFTSERCWVKKYCTAIGKNENQCSICQKVLKMPKGQYGNMKRHLRCIHGDIYEKEMQLLHGQSEDDGRDVENESTTEEEEEVLEQEILEQEEEFLEEHIEGEIEANSEIDVEGAQSPIPEETAYQDVDHLDTDSETTDFGEIVNLSINDPNLKNKIKWLSQRVVQGKRKIKTCVWNFFIPVVEHHQYTCIFCHRDISIFPQNSSNLKRHLALKHKEQFNLIKKYAPEYKQGNDGENLSILLESPKKKDIITKSFEATYFEDQGSNNFKCRSCDEIVNCQDPESLILFQHIHEKHSDEVISHINDTVADDEEFSVLLVKKKDMQIL